MSLSSVGFLQSGLTIARLKLAGTFDVVRDPFIVAMISGTNSCEHCFSSHVGIGSNSHDLTGADATNRSTSDYVTVSKQTGGTPPNTASLLTAAIVVYGRISPQSTMSFLMFDIFSIK